MLQEDIEKIIDKFDTIFVTAINGSLAYNSTERGVVGDGVKLLLEQSLKEIAHKTAEAMLFALYADQEHNGKILGLQYYSNLSHRLGVGDGQAFVTKSHSSKK